MASMNQLISELANSVKQPNSINVRRSMKLAIIHARNELIRKGFNNHSYVDKVLQQRFKVTLIDVPDGDLAGINRFNIPTIKRTINKVPRPVRFDNGIPFHSIRTVGMRNPLEVAFAKEAVANYYNHLPGMCHVITYDYINEYVYIQIPDDSPMNTLKAIVIEGVFEYPHIIETETVDGKLNIDNINDDDEFLLPEDMIGDIKKLVLETWNRDIVRTTNEVPSINVVS